MQDVDIYEAFRIFDKDGDGSISSGIFFILFYFIFKFHI